MPEVVEPLLDVRRNTAINFARDQHANHGRLPPLATSVHTSETLDEAVQCAYLGAKVIEIDVSAHFDAGRGHQK